MLDGHARMLRQNTVKLFFAFVSKTRPFVHNSFKTHSVWTAP